MNVERLHIAIAGRMNAGKSTMLNALTQNNTSLVDQTPGTTTDAKVAIMEIHGLGPVKLFDTAGLDEAGRLGGKKREKTLKIIGQSDIVCVIQNRDLAKPLFNDCIVNEYQSWLRDQGKGQDFDSLQHAALYECNTEDQVIKQCQNKHKKVMIINNDFHGDGSIKELAVEKSNNCVSKVIQTNLQKVDAHALALAIKQATQFKPLTADEFLPQKFLQNKQENDAVLLVIPLDAQSPKMRLLKPQSQSVESLISNKCLTLCYQLDLASARGANGQQRKDEVLRSLNNIIERNQTKLVVTDSQAMDIIKNLQIPVTTFSIMQIHALLGQNLFDYTTDSIRKFANVVKQQPKVLKILISEACQHDRILTCEDIGTKQIPRYLKQLLPNTDIQIVYNFGKDDQQMDGTYDYVIHCGGCMITPQQMRSRVSGFAERDIPVINYGQFISYAVGGIEVVNKVLDIW